MSAPSGCYPKKAWNSYDMNKTRYKEWLDNVYELLIQYLKRQSKNYVSYEIYM